MVGEALEGHVDKGWLLRAVRRGGPPPWGVDPGTLDTGALSASMARLGPLLDAYFHPEASGFENVPEGPVMVVSNHSGGTSIPDVWGWLLLWYRHFGFSRPLHPLAHEILFSNRFTGRWLERRGVLRASRSAAFDLLRRWERDVLVMPGGDLDTWRPYRDRYRIRFSGRKGYARAALKAGVPVVPVAHDGAHATLIVLTDGRTFARVMGLHRIARAEIWPVHLSLPWGVGIGPLPHLPLPVRLRYRIGRPISPAAYGIAGREPAPAAVAALDGRVREALQAELDVLAATRRRRGRGLTSRLAH
jgi:1-acyl-sn-glycerol-3-phosphate acyltransferase